MLVKPTLTGDNWLQKFTTEADLGGGSALNYYEKQAGSAGASVRTIFTIGKYYIIGSHTLVVAVNGQIAEVSAAPTNTMQYEETTAYTITFGASLLATDRVEFFIFGVYIFGPMHLPQVIDKAANYSVIEEDTGRTFTNIGASGAVTFDLPLVRKDLIYSFAKRVDFNFILQANAGNYIADSTIAGTLYNNVSQLWATVTLLGIDSTMWGIMAGHGTWITT